MFESLKKLWLEWKNKPTQEQIARREEELITAQSRLAVYRLKEYPIFKDWLYWKMMRYLDESHIKKDWLPLYKAEAIDEILKEIESAEKFCEAEEKNLANLRNKK